MRERVGERRKREERGRGNGERARAKHSFWADREVYFFVCWVFFSLLQRDL